MTNFGRGWRPSPAENPSLKLAGRLHELRSSLQFLDPDLVAARSGISYLTVGPDRGEFHFPFWGNAVILAWPNLIAFSNTDDELPPLIQALLLYYLITADGTPLSGKWVSFADLPGGRMYNSAYQGYSGDEIAKVFGSNLSAFQSACLKMGGIPADVGSASYVVWALPRLPLLVTYWLGDEDFPSSCKILFDSSATHYLPIDGCAIAGSMLAGKLRSPTSTDVGLKDKL